MNITQYKRRKVFEKTDGFCIYCGCDITFENFHMEHRIPRSKLPANFDNTDNLFPSCAECNLLKGNLTVEEFRKKIEELPYKNAVTRLLMKYYGKKPKKVVFYYEKLKK